MGERGGGNGWDSGRGLVEVYTHPLPRPLQVFAVHCREVSPLMDPD